MTNLRHPPPAICTDCGSNRSISQCVACGQPVCPSHRYGLGSLSDGYTCTNCPAFGFAVAAATPQPGRWFAREHRGWPRWLIGVAVLVFILMLIIAVGHPPK